MNTEKLPEEVISYLSTIGTLGGTAGKGKTKKRPPGYYSEIRKKRTRYPKWSKKQENTTSQQLNKQ